MAATMLARCHAVLLRFEANLLRALLGGNPPTGAAALAVVGPSEGAARSDSQNKPAAGKSVLETILGDGFLWAAVPKRRRSLEKRWKRKFGETHFRQAIPKKDIVACLDCGQWHQRSTICGNCYEEVKAETEAMKEKMGVDKYYYDHPRQEVVYCYEGEEDQKDAQKGKYIVEMEKPRPQWFPKNLLTKAHGRET